MKKKFALIGIATVLTVVFLSISPFMVLAQYQTQQTSDVKIASSGKASINQNSNLGRISIDIVGKPGATGSVSTATYNGNPQPDASVPNNVVLGHFLAVTFNIAPSDFKNATLKISYTDSDVAGMTQPYIIYKYDPTNNKFIPLNGQINTSSKTITVILTSTTDPLFALGGTAKATPAPTEKPETAISLSMWAWIFVAIEAFTGFTIEIGVYLQQRTVDNAKKAKMNQAK